MSDHPLTVLFDGGCPLCSREIAHYRHIAGERPIAWLDIAHPDTDLGPYGVSRLEALRVFHVIDPEGRMHTGFRAFLVLWAALPGYRWLAGFVRTLRLVSPLEWLYQRFAAWHYAKRCREDVCL